MGETIRFGVSLDSELLERFDLLCERQGYASRSEALRDIIRQALAQDSLKSENVKAAGVLSLVYDHHIRDLSKKLIEQQHEVHDYIVASMHIHLDLHNCLEVLILKGEGNCLHQLADTLRATRGVVLGSFSFLPVEDRYSS